MDRSEIESKLVDLLVDELGLVLLVGAPVQPHHGDVLEQDAVDLHLGDRAPREADHQQASVPGDALQREVEDISSHGIVDHIRPAATGGGLDLLYPVRRRIVETVFGPVAPHRVEIGRAHV